ncbi:TrlF family AAA-like ATPase [Kribbella sp. NPDC055071]
MTSRVYAGARWWSLDIHAHSPASFDYGGLEGTANDQPKPTFKEWIQAYIDAGVDGIVVADHNSHAGIDLARDALAQLREEDSSLPPFVIFPGVELTVAGGIHVLGIFDPRADAEVVNQVLTLCQFTGTRGHSDETANQTVLDTAKVITAQGGLCIPAHADRKAGVFGIDPRDLEALGSADDVMAVEVIDDTSLDQAKRLGWIPVLGSDAHHLTTDGCQEEHEAKAPGTHLTLFKAETLNLEGLRLALTDPKESVRRVLRGYTDPNNAGHGYINRISVVHGDATEEYRFGPWMNCLIGGRGVGKSTLIELLRLALGRSHELAGPVAEELRRFRPSAERGERWWDEATRIVIEYTKDDRLLRVTWSGDAPEKPSLEVREDSEWQVQAGRVFDRVPIRVFSQKQIYELATSPQSFLTILDDMPDIQKRTWEEEYELLQLNFRDERNKLRKLRAEAEKTDRIRGQLEEVQGRLKQLAELRETTEYQELSTTEARIQDATTAEQQAQSIELSVGTQASTLRGLVTDALQVADYADRAASFTAAADLLVQAATTLETARTAWKADPPPGAWQQRVADLNSWLAQQGSPSSLTPEQIQADRQREVALQIELREVESSTGACQQQEKVIASLLDELATKREDLFKRRQAYAQGLNGTTQLTRVAVHQQADLADVGQELRRLLNCPDSFDSAFSREGIAKSLLDQEPKKPQFPKAVQEFKEALIELAEQRTDSALAKSLKVDNRFYNRLAGADTFDLVTDIMLWIPDDLVAVQYRATEKSNLVPVDQGSPGQKTAALLTVILQMGTDPLLLDQPEDDLENKLIKHLAVETLKRIKAHRQVIVSTHNANIVVTSAAENILALEHGNPLPQIEAEGTLQVEKVKANVCEILEGGEDAIKTRYRRLIGPTAK